MTERTTLPRLDRSAEPWVGVFPGLGTVRVHVDGSIEVEAEPDNREPEEASMREAALRNGWGEPLSLIRRGYRCIGGSAVVPPEGSGCLILNGSLLDVATTMVELVTLGWSVLCDRVVPTRFDDGTLVAWPGSTPVLISRKQAERADLEAVPVRARSDAAAIAVSRADKPQTVVAFANVGVRRPNEEVFEQVTGHHRFRAATSMMMRGVFAYNTPSDGDAKEVLGEHLRLAELPYVRLRFKLDTLGADVAELAHWWSSWAEESSP